MQLVEYFAQQNGTVSFTEEQASDFAKSIAGDFNPIHDTGTRRFCVPGDLLFCVLLHKYGVASLTAVQFSGMLDGKTQMCIPESIEKQAHLVDTKGRALLSVFLEGHRLDNPVFVAALSEAYVKFSGQTFPDILVPLMRSANVMINPDRPLVIYKDMMIELDAALDNLEQDGVVLESGDTNISVDGRKAAVQLTFDIQLDGRSIGRGEKNMVLSGLREYDDASIQKLIEQYNQRREQYAS